MTSTSSGPSSTDGAQGAHGVDPKLETLLATGKLGVLATLKRDGRPQLSNVTYHYDAGSQTARVSITADRAKTKNLARDPRASLSVSSPDGWSYVVLEAVATLSPVAAAGDDATVDELVGLYRAVGGEHPDWPEYRAAMVADKRLVLRLPLGRLYGLVR